MSTDASSWTPEQTTVERLREALSERLGLELVAGTKGLANRIESPRIQKLGLALAGYTDYIHSGRVQFLGRTEMNFLSRLPEAAQRQAVGQIFSRSICCVLITSGFRPPAVLLQLADELNVPAFCTEVQSSAVIGAVTGFLEDVLAPSLTIHAVLMEIAGKGVLLLGESGIGKSECALDLILRGHRLVSDDVVILRRLSRDRLEGCGPPEFQDHMELRGLGIVNVRDLFGVSALRERTDIHMAIELVRWEGQPDCDRLGLDEREYQTLGVSLPLIHMPVASGRNLATLVEVAVRIRMLKERGFDPARRFLTRLDSRLREHK